MMKPATLRLVLLISCCHALVHVYEHSFACVEQLVADDPAFGIRSSEDSSESPDDAAVGDNGDEAKRITGTLGSALRLPFGLCALLAGWLADRYGARRLLLIYLVGCSVAAWAACFSPGLAFLYLAMFTLGMFASIYHPAGVGLISHCTTPENRPMALGYHGIFGSAGIAAGPLLAGLAFNAGATWRQYYLALTIPGILLALLLHRRLSHQPELTHAVDPDSPASDGEDDAHWVSFFTLLLLASLSGFVYAAILNFLPRYLGGSGLVLGDIPDAALRNYLTSAVLLLGIIGQYTAGRLARPSTLEPLMAGAFFATVPCVLWMAFAEGAARIWAAALFAPAFFMHQPLYNSLVSKYVPRRRRSTCYGLSFTLGFGVGALGPTFAGFAGSNLVNFGTLAAILMVVAVLALVLWRWHGPEQPPGD